jgi:hypothetical protein
MNRQALNVTQPASQSCPAVRLICAVLSHTAARVHGKAPVRAVTSLLTPFPFAVTARCSAVSPSHLAPLKSRAVTRNSAFFFPRPRPSAKGTAGRE